MLVRGEEGLLFHGFGIEVRGEAGKFIAAGKSQVLEAWCTPRQEKGVDLIESDEHWRPYVSQNLQ